MMKTDNRNGSMGFRRHKRIKNINSKFYNPKEKPKILHLRPTGPVTEDEPKGFQFPKRESNKKKQYQSTDSESESDETNN